MTLPKVEYALEKETDIIHKNYTMILSKEKSPLAEYIAGNMQEYTELLIENCKNQISDDESCILLLVNNEDVAIDTRKAYIQRLVTTITDISKINDTELWKDALSKGIISFSVSNFIRYFQNFGLDSNLCEFVNTVQGTVDFTNVASEFGEATAEKLFDEVVVCNDVKIDKYRKILNDLSYLYDKYETTEISDEKMRILIEDRIIDMSVESLLYMRESYEDDVIYFIKQNIDKYMEMQTADIFSLEEAIQVLDLDISDEKKIALLGFTNNSISVIEKNYSDELKAFIISNNADSRDLDYLYKNYLHFKEKTRNSILKVAINNADNIIGEDRILDDALLSKLLIANELSREVKIQLFNGSISRLNEETCKTHFDELELPDLKAIFTKRNTTTRNYEKSEDVTAIFEALKRNSWIYDFYESDENPDQYIVLKNAPKSKAPEFLD